MLDIKYILENTEQVRTTIQKRGVKADLDKLLSVYAERKQQKIHLDNQRAEANHVAKTIPTVPASEKTALINQGRALNQDISALEEIVRRLDEQYRELMLTIPNIMAEDTPLGASDAENEVLRYVLEPRTFDFTPRDHLELGKSLNLIDFESGAKVTGSKFYFLKNEAVLLEMALKLFAMKTAQTFGYTPFVTPDLAKKSILAGTGFSPRGEESNIYNVESTDLSLIATAEITMCGMHADEMLEEAQLPLKYIAESHCFRREAGASGQENKGLYRVHQFSKIELFQITTPGASEAALQEILHIEESIYQQLNIPYRVVRICTGDIGAAAYKKYDIEAWMPGKESQEKYGEVTSASNCTDYQSRRLNIRYRTRDNTKVFPHTLNGTAIALSRTLLAILENYQQQDGSVVIPDVLRPYIGKERITR